MSEAMSEAAKCERHQVWTWTMTWAEPNNEPAPKLCPLCLTADLADLKELTNRRIAPILEQIEKFRIELSELGLRTDNHNASRKVEIGYLRADVDRIDRINTGVLLELESLLKMGPARELRLIGAKLVSRVADWLGDVK